MKVLVIKATYPFPLNTGGSVVAYNNIKWLSHLVDMHLICLGRPDQKGDIPSLVNRLDIVERKKNNRLCQLAWYGFCASLGIPPTVAVHSSAQMRSKVRREIERENFDVILVYEMSGIQYCPASALHKIVVNVEDPQALKLRRSAGLSSWTKWQRVKIAISAFLTERYERRMFQRLGHILLLSQNDAAALRESLVNANVSAIPYGVDARDDADIVDYSGRLAGSIIFSGNMFHPTNVDAILYFLSKIFPRVLASNPAARLWIVGADPREEILEAASAFGSSVIVTGKVSDVQRYVRQSMVSICPVRLDIGVQTKVLEALSWGTPVVSTSAGNSGIQGTSGRHLWVEDAPDRFADRVSSLLDGQQWQDFSKSGREFSRTEFSWARSAAELQRHLAAVAEAGNGRREAQAPR